MELKIQKLLRNQGLEKTVNDLKLICKINDDGRILLKYHQLDAIWSEPATHECRGIILDRFNNFNIVSYSYNKFFNYGESYAAKLNNNIKWYKKYDGSLMTMYYWNNSWHVQTSGNIDAFEINLIHTNFGETFKKCVINTYGSYENLISKLNTNYCYIFEMMSPENIVVIQHSDYSVVLHGVRDLTTLKELHINNFKNEFIIAEEYNFNDINHVLTTATELPWTEEGYIGVDNDFNRIKIKGKEYVAVHYTATGISPYSFLDVIKMGEVDEYLVYFEHKKDYILDAQMKYNNLINNYNWAWDINKDKWNKLSRKEVAIEINERFHSYLKSFLFNKLDNPELDARTYINEKINVRHLFKLLNLKF